MRAILSANAHRSRLLVAEMATEASCCLSMLLCCAVTAVLLYNACCSTVQCLFTYGENASALVRRMTTVHTSYRHIRHKNKYAFAHNPSAKKTISPFTRSTDSTNTRHKPIRKRETFLVQLTSLGCSTDAKKATSANLAHTCPSHQAGVPLGEITCNLQSPDETHDLQGRSTNETGT